MYVVYEDIENDEGRVSVIVYEDNGLIPPQNSVEVKDVAEPQQFEGKISVPYINLRSNEVFYKYIDTPQIFDPVKEIELLKIENLTLKEESNINQLALMELHTLLLSLTEDTGNKK